MTVLLRMAVGKGYTNTSADGSESGDCPFRDGQFLVGRSDYPESNPPTYRANPATDVFSTLFVLVHPVRPDLSTIHSSAWKGYSQKFGLDLRKRSSPLAISQVSRRVQAPKRTLKEVKHMNGGKGIYVGGTLISILISLALYFSGKRETAIFVGLWAPTILNLGQTLMDED
jgi:hypothetical protein